MVLCTKNFIKESVMTDIEIAQSVKLKKITEMAENILKGNLDSI